jgi:hypothetical protein
MSETNFAARILQNKHLAGHIRQRLLARNGAGAVREVLAQMSDEDLVVAYLQDQAQRSKRAEKKKSAKLTVIR